MNLIYSSNEIQKNLLKIIDAYVDYFGIEHKEQINKRFNNINFLTCSNPKILQKYYKENKDKEDLAYIKEYLDLCEKDKRNIQLEENIKLLENKAIIKPDRLIEQIRESSSADEQNSVAFWIFINKDNALELIPTVYLVNACLAYNYRDRVLFHEINHCVETSYEVSGNRIYITSGIESRTYDIYNENDSFHLRSIGPAYISSEIRELNEFLNDRISHEICLRFKKKGNNILDNNKNIEMTKENTSPHYIAQLEPFFKEYEEAIKLSRLYGDFNILLNSVGVPNEYEFMKLLYTKYGAASLFNGAQIDEFNSEQNKVHQ
jgi:hypothetical protein